MASHDEADEDPAAAAGTESVHSVDEPGSGDPEPAGPGTGDPERAAQGPAAAAIGAAAMQSAEPSAHAGQAGSEPAADPPDGQGAETPAHDSDDSDTDSDSDEVAELLAAPEPPFDQRMWTDPNRFWGAGPLPIEHTGPAAEVEKRVLGAARFFDRLQSRVAPIAFIYAVVKKYADDQGGRHAGLLAYYTFLSFFPLAIGGVAVLSIVLSDRPDTVQSIISDAVPEEYVPQVMAAYNSLPDSGITLVVALVGLLLAGTGGIYSLYFTINQVFAVPYRFRYGFGPRYLRVILVVVLMAVGVLVLSLGTTVVSSLLDVRGINRAAVFILTTAIFTGILYLAAKILSRRPLGAHELLLGAVLGGVWTSGIASLGTLIVSGFVANSSAVYGAFATVVGIISVLLLVSNGVVFALEASAVRAWQLWPRGIDIHLLYPADERAYALLTLMDERMPSSRNDPRFDAIGHDDPRRPPMGTLDHRQPGIPRTPFEELG